MYTVEIAKEFKARQGLSSPIRNTKGLKNLVPPEGFNVIMRIGVSFSDSQLTQKGWFVDTDALDERIDTCCAHLASEKWTELFDFRPTFELVTRWAYGDLKSDISQLEYVELENCTIRVKTVYRNND